MTAGGIILPPPGRGGAGHGPAARLACGPRIRKSFCFSVQFFPFSIPRPGAHNGGQGHSPRLPWRARQRPAEARDDRDGWERWTIGGRAPEMSRRTSVAILPARKGGGRELCGSPSRREADEARVRSSGGDRRGCTRRDASGSEGCFAAPGRSTIRHRSGMIVAGAGFSARGAVHRGKARRGRLRGLCGGAGHFAAGARPSHSIWRNPRPH